MNLQKRITLYVVTYWVSMFAWVGQLNIIVCLAYRFWYIPDVSNEALLHVNTWGPVAFISIFCNAFFWFVHHWIYCGYYPFHIKNFMIPWSSDRLVIGIARVIFEEKNDSEEWKEYKFDANCIPCGTASEAKETVQELLELSNSLVSRHPYLLDLTEKWENHDCLTLIKPWIGVFLAQLQDNCDWALKQVQSQPAKS